MIAFLWMSGSVASFCLMAVGARELSGELSIFQMLSFRSLIGLLCLSVIMFFAKEKPAITTNRLPLHAFRNLVHFVGQYGWFLGMSLLPLAEVFALEFTTPVWTALIAAFFLNEKITSRKILAILLGLAGVMIIVQPGYAIVDSSALIVLAAALCYAMSHTATKSLSSSEKPLSILFYMCLLQLPMALCFSLTNWQWPQGLQWLWLTVVGLTALSAHYCIAKAMLHTEVTTVVTLDFLRLPVIALIAGLLYKEAIEPSLFIGAALMLAGNLLNTARQKNSINKGVQQKSG